MSPTAPHQALYRRWRAQTFGQIVGQEAVVETLRNAVRLDQVSHALLFVGPRGTGKTSMARIVAKALNCTDLRDGEPCDRCEACTAIREGRALDVVEMDAASNNRVDDMRDLLARTMTAPSDLRRKVYIVDEVQRIREGWDVLLRTLEEPPDHVAFIFCTTDASQIRPAVLSRVQRFDFRRLTVPQIEGKLRMILEADGRTADPDAVALVARLAAGGMRDAESMLDQLLSSGSERLTADQVRGLLGLAEAESVRRFVGALVDGDALAGIAILDELEERGRDLRTFLDQVVEVVREELVASLAGTPTGASGSGDDPARLGLAGRRLGAIDPARGGPGGLRFQLELALLGSPGAPGEAALGAFGLARRPAMPQAANRVAPGPSGRRPAATSSPGRRSGVEVTPTAGPSIDAVAPPAAEVPPVPSPGPPPEPEAVASPVPPVAHPPVDRGEEAMPVAVGPGDGGGEATLEELRRRWPEIVGHISQHPPTKPLIAACRPIGVDGSVVTLGFPEEQAFLKDVAERRRGILEEGVGRYLGRPVIVRCVATNLDVVAPSPGDDEAARLLDEARRIFADDLLDVGEVG